MPEILDDMIATALDRLELSGGECTLDDLENTFDPISVAMHGERAISEARRKRLDKRVAADIRRSEKQAARS